MATRSDDLHIPSAAEMRHSLRERIGAQESDLARVTAQRDAAVEALADIIGTMTLEGVPQSIIEKCAAKARAALVPQGRDVAVHRCVTMDKDAWHLHGIHVVRNVAHGVDDRKKLGSDLAKLSGCSVCSHGFRFQKSEPQRRQNDDRS